jgi:hypothetical protein
MGRATAPARRFTASVDAPDSTSGPLRRHDVGKMGSDRPSARATGERAATTITEFGAGVREVIARGEAVYARALPGEPKTIVISGSARSEEYGLLPRYEVGSEFEPEREWKALFAGRRVIYMVGRFKDVHLVCAAQPLTWSKLPEAHMLVPKAGFSKITQRECLELVGEDAMRELRRECLTIGVSLRWALKA